MTNKDNKHKIAVLLLNLGGPDNLESVNPFLFNLFNDKAIIRLPSFMRVPLAYYITLSRQNKTKSIYRAIGDKSPILEETQLQAAALEKILNTKNKNKKDNEYKTFIIMRYWHPRAIDVVKKVESYKPHKIILLPLYPQFSTTTTQSSFQEWQDVKYKTHSNFECIETYIPCYHNHPLFIDAQVDVITQHYKKIVDKISKKNIKFKKEKILLIFSAHGLPQSVIDNGDPYQKQIEESVKLIVKKFEKTVKKQKEWPSFEYKITYQSKVGRLKWLEPNTEDEIKKYSEDKRAMLIIPIAFVSEHSETLVELDIEYKKIAYDNGCLLYERASTLRTNHYYIECLADLCIKS